MMPDLAETGCLFVPENTQESENNSLIVQKTVDSCENMKQVT
jgi:hypothetical protein